MTTSNIIHFPAVTAGQTGQHGHAMPTRARLIDLPEPERTDAARGATNRNLEQTNRLLDSSEVGDALNANRLVMHYQPQYDLQSKQTVAAEALLRLVDSKGQLIYPDRFIDRVERSDLIVPLGRAVIEQACTDLASLRSLGLSVPRIAINVSTYQLATDSELLEFLDQTLARYALDDHDLEFELTERQPCMPDSRAASVLRALALRGARIVIDDFGTGYSLMVYLTELPVSAIKLDRSFVRRLPDNQAMRSVVRYLLAMARDLGLEVVAEGVETLAQQHYLAEVGCRYAQGFGYARPMSVEALQVCLSASTSSLNQEPARCCQVLGG